MVWGILFVVQIMLAGISGFPYLNLEFRIILRVILRANAVGLVFTVRQVQHVQLIVPIIGAVTMPIYFANQIGHVTSIVWVDLHASKQRFMFLTYHQIKHL